MFENIPSEIFENLKLYFQIEMPVTEPGSQRDKFSQIYNDAFLSQDQSYTQAPNTGTSVTFFSPPASYTSVQNFGGLTATQAKWKEAKDGTNITLIMNAFGPEFFTTTVQAVYDSRLLSPSISIYANLINRGESPWAIASRYSNTLYRTISHSVNFIVNASPIIQPFNGLQSLIYLSENGVQIENFDASKAKLCLAYINGSSKYASEIDFAIEAKKRDERMLTQNFINDLTDKLDRDTNELKNQQLQIKVAMDNETSSAKRDIQNLLIAAMGLKI